VDVRQPPSSVHFDSQGFPSAHTHTHTHTRARFLANTMEQTTSSGAESRSLGRKIIHDFRNYQLFAMLKSPHHEPLQANQYLPLNSIEIHSFHPITPWITDRATVKCHILQIEGCRVVSATDPYDLNLGFLERSRCFPFHSKQLLCPQIALTGWAL
jgi:hypothetical protein